MIAETVSESGSKKPRRGRPQSWVRDFAEELRQRGLLPDNCGYERSRVHYAYRMVATSRAMRLLSADERAVLFGPTDEAMQRREAFPRGWDSAAVEIGRLLSAIDQDDDTVRGYLLVAVNARRTGDSWRTIRSHFRSLRLGERQGNAVSLLMELARAIDGYRSRFPATTDRMTLAAVRSLVEVISEQINPESGSPAETVPRICDP
jgi:hypothetical protein